MSDPSKIIWAHEVHAIGAALDWAERTWPHDAGEWPASEFFADVHPPDRLKVKSHDGYRIGWIKVLDDQWVFERDYDEHDA